MNEKLTLTILKEEKPVKLMIAILIAFSIAFFFYYGLDTMNDSVFSIDFIPYHFTGILIAKGDLAPITNYTETGGFFATSGPYLEYFHKYFFPTSIYATRWVYLPAYAWIFRPLANFDFKTAAYIWLAFNMLLTILCVWLIWDVHKTFTESKLIRNFYFAWILFFGLTFQPILDNIWHGQVTGLIFFVFCFSYWLLQRNNLSSSGLILGLIIPFKIYPALFILYFIWRKKWRLVAGSFVGVFIVTVISLLTVGFKGNIAYLNLILSELGKGGIPAFNNQSILGFLFHAFTKGDVNAWLKVDIPIWLNLLRYIMIFILCSGVIWSMHKKSEQKISQDLEICLIIFVMLLISPITWYHYLMWLLLPIVILFNYFLISTQTNYRQMAFYAVAYALIVVQGIVVIRPIFGEALQNNLILRILLSQSFVGIILLTLVVVRLRLNLDKKIGIAHKEKPNN